MKNNVLLLLSLALFTVASCKKEGCTDPNAINYDADAKKDDGTCTYLTASPTLIDCDAYNTSGAQYTLVDLGLPVDYTIDCQIVVRGDLTINPGVTIQFTSDAGIEVVETGSIAANGGNEKSIVFTGVDKVAGAWAGIFVDANDVKNKIQGCIIEFAGGDAFNSNDDRGAFILYADTRMEISNCTIRDSETYGINANYGEGEFIFSNNTITRCSMPMFIEAEYCGSISGGTYTENTTNVIYVSTYAGSAYVENAQTWTDLNIPYRVKTGGQIQVRQVTLTIAAGVEIEFETNSGIYVNDNSALKALGTANNRILFTGVDKLPGAWGGIEFHFTQSPVNEIGFATIEYGANAETRGSIYMWANPVVNVHDVTFRDLTSCAFYDAPKTQPNPTQNPNLTISNCEYIEVDNQASYVTDALNTSYCFGG
jgi:hypothetical protein